jgi:hypothetical protein
MIFGVIMEKSMKFLLFAYFITFCLLLFYLINFETKSLSPIYFFVIIIASIFSLTFQILKFGEVCHKLILFQIYLFSLSLHLIFVLPNYELFGYDGYANFSSIWLLKSNLQFGTPNLQILFLILENILNIKSIFLIKYLPSFYSAFSIILIYKISNIYFEKRPSLLSSFMFSSVNYYAMFHSWFVKEGLAFLIFLTLIYLILKYCNNVSSSIITIILISSMVLTHHLTPFLFILFLFIMYTYTWIFSLKIRKANLERLIILSFVILLSYWLYNYMWPLVSIVESFEKNIILSNLFSTDVELTQLLIIRKYGYWLLILIFGSLSALNIYHILKIESRHKFKANILSMCTFSYIMGIGYFMGSYNIISTPLATNRLFTFSWPFLLIVSMPYVFKKRYLQKLIYPLVLYLILFNVAFLFPHYSYTQYNPKLMEKNEVDFRISESQIYAEKWSNLSGNIATGSSGENLLSKHYLEYNRISIFAPNIFQGDFSEINRYDWIYMYPDMFYNLAIGVGKPLTKANFDKINSNPYINLVYDNNNYIYKIQK